MTNTNEIFNTCNRRLEQFLFAHDIMYINCEKNADNMTVWSYRQTPELNRVVNEWRDIVAKHVAKKH